MEEFMNTYEEIHSFWYGLSDAWKWVHDPADRVYEESRAEPHYYRLGYMVGGVTEGLFWYFLGLLSCKAVLYAM